MPETNVIVIMTDELRRDCTGCYGNELVKTPNIDALASRGIRFDAAYTPSPICVPARAAIATGRYVHETRCWANAMPYSGTPESWHHRIRNAGRKMASIGKLHFRSTNDDNGFSEEINPLHVRNGEGWVHGLLRDEMDLFDASGFAANIGPGMDDYTRYDEAVTEATVNWLQERGYDADDANPWGLYVSYLRPHYPLTCPPEFYNLYDPDKVPDPKPGVPGSGHDHPVLQGMRTACDYDAPFNEETRRIAVASYYGLCSFVDAQVGKIVNAIEAAGLQDDTTIIFTSDHGECLGDRGFWTKMVMYEEASAVPLIMAGPETKRAECKTPVSLIDLFPTVLQLSGAEEPKGDQAPHHCRSLLDIAEGQEPDRTVFSEYHDYGAITGMFLLRQGKWKLVVYPGYSDQLYDLEADPEENIDLAPNPEYAEKIEELRGLMKQIADPEQVNVQAFADQAERIEALGGKDSILAMENFDHTPVEQTE